MMRAGRVRSNQQKFIVRYLGREAQTSLPSTQYDSALNNYIVKHQLAILVHRERQKYLICN